MAAAVVAAAFCVRALADGWDRVGDDIAGAEPSLLGAAVATAAATMVVVATGWPRILSALGHPVDRARALRWYFVGELGKYVPGLVWPVVGRAELAHRGGIDRRTAYTSVGVSLGAWYGSLVLPAAATVLRRRARLPGAVRLVAWYLPSWAGVGAVSALVAAALDVGGSPWRIAVAAVGAWVAGFLAVPVPAGAGVRELVFIAAAGLPDHRGAAVAVAARLCFVAVDLTGAGVAVLSRARG